MSLYEEVPDQDMTDFFDNHLAVLLARMVPAVSPAAGQAAVQGQGISDINLMDQRDQDNWPREVWEEQTSTPWWHRDHRRVAYVYVNDLYDLIVSGATDCKLNMIE